MYRIDLISMSQLFWRKIKKMIKKHPENLHNFYFALFLIENNINDYKEIVELE